MTQNHILPVSVYALVFIALLVLTGVTVGVALVDLGPLNTFVAMSIAVLKALLVVLFFMHVLFSHRLVWLFVGAGFFWLVILIGLLMSDIASRDWMGIPMVEFFNQG
jgi:cytochrome c oxidase subunit 4